MPQEAFPLKLEERSSFGRGTNGYGNALGKYLEEIVLDWMD